MTDFITNKKQTAAAIKAAEDQAEKFRDEKFTTLLLDDQVEETQYFYEEAKKLRKLYDTDRELWNKKIKEHNEKRNELEFGKLSKWIKDYEKKCQLK
jgi:hypothetical protein